MLHDRLRQRKYLQVEIGGLPAALYRKGYRAGVMPEDLYRGLVFLSNDRTRSGGSDRPAVVQPGIQIGGESGNTFIAGISRPADGKAGDGAEC